ncbi:hypothetical protein, partial [Flagellimonas beolgyonensis]
KSKWRAKDSAPMGTKGRKDADFRNQTTLSRENRFPWTTIIVLILIVMTVGFVLFFVAGMS